MSRKLSLLCLIAAPLAWFAACGAPSGRYGGAAAQEGASASAPEPAASDEVWYIEREPSSPSERAPGAPTDTARQPGSQAWLDINERRQRERGQADELDSLPTDELPGCGGMIAQRPNATGLAAIPLEHTTIDAGVQGTSASVRVRQRFTNPWSEKIEAIYVFPLPADAAVHDFVMTIGTRTIRGIVREREEARQLYTAARAQGHVAALLTQERANVFTQKVANIEPGKSIDIDVRYFHGVPWIDGWHELVIPTVVGPRFSPPGQRSGIGAVAQGAGGSSGQPVELEYRRPERWSPNTLDIAVDIDAGAEIEGLECRTHEIHVERPSESRHRVTLDGLDRVANRDFVLRWKVGGERLTSSFVTRDDGRDGWFQLTLYPPTSSVRGHSPLDLILVVDTSGSMQGGPLACAKSAMHRALERLAPPDTFQIVRFAQDASSFSDTSVVADSRALAQAHVYVDQLQAGGGTMVLAGLKAALAQPRVSDRRRMLVFLTDGFIDNEEEILSALDAQRGDVRVLSLGIGSACNRFLLDELARIGRGAASYLGPRDDSARIARIVERFVDTMRAPALADVAIDWGGLDVESVYPSRIPDVLRGRPVTLTGRLGRGAAVPATIRVRGTCENETRELAIPARFDRDESASRALPLAWARARIADLERRAVRASHGGAGGNERGEILSTALEFGLVSPLTSFVAVDSLTRTAGDHGTSVNVPVALPDGVRYDTTVTGPR